jgi:hypothetical protein
VDVMVGVEVDGLDAGGQHALYLRLQLLVHGLSLPAGQPEQRPFPVVGKTMIAIAESGTIQDGPGQGSPFRKVEVHAYPSFQPGMFPGKRNGVLESGHVRHHRSGGDETRTHTLDDGPVDGIAHAEIVGVYDRLG